MSYEQGRCSLGKDCHCPTGQLHPKYMCALCGEQLHSFVQGCSAVYSDDNKVMCKEGFGCNIQKQQARQVPRNSPEEPAPNQQKVASTQQGAPSRTYLASTSKKRLVKPGGLKRGVKPGTKFEAKKTQEDWYIVCDKYHNFLEEGKGKMTKAAFLKSNLSGDLFTGTLSEQQSFGRMLKSYDKGHLKPTKKKRRRIRKYEEIEKKLIEYLDLHAQAYKQDKCGLSWILLQKKCLQFADLLGYEEFHASPGWISDTLKNHGRTGIIKQLESEVPSNVMDDNKDNDKPETTVPTFLEAEKYIDLLRRYSESVNLRTEERHLLDRFAHSVQAEWLSRPRSSPTLHHFFGPKDA